MRRHLAFDAGVVEEAVDAAVGVDGRLDVALHLGRLGDVGDVERGVAALLADGGGGAFGAGASWSTTTTLAPRPANASAAARPMPLPAPVMSATLPVKSMCVAPCVFVFLPGGKRNTMLGGA